MKINFGHLVVLGCIYLFAVGCNGKREVVDKPDQTVDPFAKVTAKQVFDQMVNAYGQANSYSDQAVLYLTYRLENRAIQEPQPWSTTVDRVSGKFAGQYFDTQIRFDGEQLGVRVYDIPTENLDNQFLLLNDPTFPLEKVVEDPIARHFVGGYSEFPINEDSPQRWLCALPPVVQLLTGKTSFPWISNPQRLERMEDQAIEGVACFHLKTWAANDPCEFWIERETGLIHQMLLPNSMLESKVSNSPQIEDLKMVARFHQCRLDQSIASNQFTLSIPEQASVVTEFVKLPEVFPSELIGKTAPPFELKTPTGMPVQRDQMKGKPTAFLWIAGFAAETGIQKFEKLSRAFGDQINLAVIYSDAEMAFPDGSQFDMSPFLQDLKEKQSISTPFLCDWQLATSNELRIKAIPSVLVMDGAFKIQFAQPLSEESWDEELSVALKRILAGDDLAEEMIEEYGRFYSQYRAKVRSVSVQKPGVSASVASTTINDSGSNVIATWKSDTLLQPGNLSAWNSASGIRLAVLDGFRSVCVLSGDGKEIARKNLELPTGEGVSQLRVGQSSDQWLLAVFSKRGSQVHFFDSNFEHQFSFPQQTKDDIQISDVQIFEGDNGALHALVSTPAAGVVDLEINTKEMEVVSELSVSELTAAKQGFVAVVNNELVKSDLPEFKPGSMSNWRFTKVAGTVGDLCAIGMVDDGDWQAIGFNEKMAIQWKADIGSQEFQVDVDSVQFVPEAPCWVIADSDFGYSVLGVDGTILCHVRVDGAINGIRGFVSNNKMFVAHSSDGQVFCNQIDLK